MMARGISRVDRDTAEMAANEARSSGTHVVALRYGVRDKKSLFDAMREAAPLDPPLTRDRHNWDALEDALWSGLHAVSEPNILIVWPDASEMLDASPNDFETAAAMLEEVTRTLDDPKLTSGHAKNVAVVLGGVWM